MVLVQAANEAVAKKTQANPVATRFNLPRFLRAVLSAMIPRLKLHFSYKPLTNQEFHPAFH
jgi:hypothetical protein